MINPIGCSSKRNQKGFSLVEIIAVLVILGITVAFISLNYLSLLADAGNSAAMQAVTEGKARLNQQYAIMLLNEDPHVHKLDKIVEGVSTDAGDYELIFDVSKNHKEVEVKAVVTKNQLKSGQFNHGHEILIRWDGYTDWLEGNSPIHGPVCKYRKTVRKNLWYADSEILQRKAYGV